MKAQVGTMRRPAAATWVAIRGLCTGLTAGTEWKSLVQRLGALRGAAEGSVAGALDGWVAEGRKANPSQLMYHVRQLRRQHRHAHALEVMEWMKTRGVKMTSGNDAVHLDLISKVKGIDSAEEYFSSLSEPSKNQGTYGALLSCYCTKQMTEKAIALYQKMKDLNLTSNSLAYSNLMSLHMKLGQLEKVLDLFQEMKASNISPDICTYRILIQSYASVNDIASVERTVEEMEGSQITLDWSTYCQLADIYNSAGLFEKASTALKKAELVMESHDLSPFPALIRLYAGAGNLAAVKWVWKLLKARVSRPTNKHYFVMLRALHKLDDMDALKDCFEEWESGCVNYDMKLVNVVIRAYLGKDRIKEAKLLQEKVVQRSSS